MRKFVLAGFVILSLAACNKSTTSDSDNGFASPGAAVPTGSAAGSNKAAPAPTVVPNTPEDPKTASCGAPKAKAFIGNTDSPEVRESLMTAAQAPGGVRFVLPGQPTTDDLRSDRLNVMIDVTHVIRDLRCG
ncbi:MAG TPA: hypothetical protein VJM34_17140 [Novosphingobium sp.]|nr:hypothetical protein [Novosphingobium sp.]